MIHLFMNALAASAGGGLTYVRNVIPQIAARSDARATVLLDRGLRCEFLTPSNVEFLEWEGPSRPALRFWMEQREVRELARRSGAGVLLSAGNFAVWNSPLPQLLLSRNSLYTSRDFEVDLRARGEYRIWLDTRMKAEFANWSIRAADRVVAPSQSFADELQRWTGQPVSAIHHGLDRDTFLRDYSPLPDVVRQKLESAHGALRLLFVSHYNYYRNFETLIRALPLIRQ
jgi:glycosyltransferase involved in cell wall biosynthesis